MKIMVTPRLPNDKIIIAPGVLLTTVKMAALQVPGVARIGSTPGGVNRLLRRAPGASGIQLLIEDPNVTVDVYIVAKADAVLHEVCRNVQKHVARDIQENVGMNVTAVNVHVEDVTFD